MIPSASKPVIEKSFRLNFSTLYAEQDFVIIINMSSSHDFYIFLVTNLWTLWTCPPKAWLTEVL